MVSQKVRLKVHEWLKRYFVAEILATVGGLAAATLVYFHTHSYIAAATSGWIGEGIGFYGYFMTKELLFNSEKYSKYSPLKRIIRVVTGSSRNLVAEFLPAEIIDSIIIRPFAMYIVPQHVHPYAVGFLVAKFGSDLLFYALAIIGYEARKHWLKH